MKIKPTKSLNLPPGEYVARIITVESQEGNYGPVHMFTFMIERGEHKKAELQRMLPAKITDRNLYGKLITALFGSVDMEKEYDTDEFEFKPVILVIENRETKQGIFGRIVDFKPFKEKDEPKTT